MGRKLLLYHIETNIEHSYITVFDAVRSLQELEVVEPWIPGHTMRGEDETIPRICVAESIEECVLGCDLWRFHRCCEKVPGMEHFADEMMEAYPIIIQAYAVDPADVHKPTPEEVPDADMTGELWLTKPTRPIRREMVWLPMDAITAPEDVVLDVRMLSTEEAIRYMYNHPWLNQRGHCLDSLALEREELIWQVQSLA